MSNYRTGPDYLKRLGVTIVNDRLTMRTPISVPGIYWSVILSALAALPLSLILVQYKLVPSFSNVFFGGFILGTMICGPLLYLLFAQLLRRPIELDRARNLLLIRNQEISLLSDVDHIEKVQGLVFWCNLAFVLKNGRKIYFLKHPDSHSSADTVAETLSSFLHVPFKDYGQGNYYEILRLVIEGDRLTMNPPDESVSRWITNIALVMLTVGALYFAFVIFPQRTGHEMIGGRGLGLIIFGLAACIKYLATRIFHHRIVLDKKTDRLTVGFRRVSAVHEIAQIGLHVKQKDTYKMVFVLREGRQVPIISYEFRALSTLEVATTIAQFLDVQVVDFEEWEQNHAIVQNRRSLISS